MPKRGNIGKRPGLRFKSRVREGRSVGRLAGVDAGRLLRERTGNVHGLGLVVGSIVDAHAPCGDLAVVLSPDVAGRVPFMRADVDDDVLCGHGQAVAAALALGESASACQEVALCVVRIVSCIIRQDGNRLSCGGAERVVVEQACGKGVQPGYVVGGAACARQRNVGSRCDGIAPAALVVCTGHEVIAVGHASFGTSLPAVEVLRLRPLPDCGSKDAVPDRDGAVAAACEAAAKGGVYTQEAAVDCAAGDGDRAVRIRIADQAAVSAFSIEIRVDRHADAAVVEAANSACIGKNSGCMLLHGGKLAVHAEIAEGCVLGVPEGGAALWGIGSGKAQRITAAVIVAGKGVALCADHIRIDDGNVRGLTETQADAGVAAVHIGLQLQPILP